MKLINYTNPRLLIADEGKHIRRKDDVYISEHKDKETGEIIPEHNPYYATVIFPAIELNAIEKCEEVYVEEEIKDLENL